MASQRKNYFFLCVLGLSLLLLWPGLPYNRAMASAAAMDKAPLDDSRFAAMQAAYIYNITKFFQWPEQPGHSSFDICLLGPENSILLSQLRKGTEKRQLQQLPVRVLHISTTAHTEAATGCRVLYFTQAPEQAGLAELPQLHHQQVLRIAAPDVSSSQYSQVDMVLEGNRIVLYVKAQALTDSGLQANAAFLSIARQR